MTNLPTEPQRLLNSSVGFRRWGVFLGVALAILAVDQLAKLLVMARLNFGESVAPIPALQALFTITLSANTGAALGIIPQAGNLFLIIALVMSIALLIVYPRLTSARWIERVALGLLLGGTLGNALDRIRLGYVVDFVHIRLGSVISNVSNFADHAIVLGIGILLIVQWQRDRRAALQKQQLSTQQPTELES